MPLLGQAALLLAFDVAGEAVAEHDDWHTHEHLPERLAIPGFHRGTRWVALQGRPRYFVLYEVEDLATLSSAAYRERLDHPTPWTTKMMPHYRGMHRGLCSVAGSAGSGSGHVGLLVRFRPVAGNEPMLGAWIRAAILAQLPERAGLGSAHWLHGAALPAMTSEQALRGADAGIDWAVLATGYDSGAVAALMQTDLGPERLAAEGATDVVSALYRMDYAVVAGDLASTA